MSKVSITKAKLDYLANCVSSKSGESIPLSIDAMADAVLGIQTGGGSTLITKSITQNGTYNASSDSADGYSSVSVSVSAPAPTLQTKSKTYTPTTSQQTDTVTADSGYDGIGEVDVTVNAMPTFSGTAFANGEFTTQGNSNSRLWKVTSVIETNSGEDGYIGVGSYNGATDTYYAVPSNTSITPAEYTQTVGGANFMMEGAVTVNAIPSTYVGSGITRRSSSDLTASGATVTVPSGYYSAQASKDIALVPYVIRPDAELIQTYTSDQMAVSDLGLTIPSYTTTAQTLKASSNLSPTVSVDLNNYRYIVVERFLSIPEYNVTTKGKGRAEYLWCNYIYEVARSAANEFATIIDPTKMITSVQNMWSTSYLYRLLYWSSTSAITLYGSNAYGCYQTPAAPSISGSTMTIKAPALGVRGHSTYFTNTYMNALTDIRYQYVIDVYRAPNTLNVDGWEQDQLLQHMIDCIQTSDHKLT